MICCRDDEMYGGKVAAVEYYHDTRIGELLHEESQSKMVRLFQ